MKKILKKLGIIVSTLIFFIARPASINDLAGSYTKLPEELRELSIVYGAAAWGTDMIRRAYNDAFATKDQSINKAATQLIKILFYKVPGSEEIALSKKRYLSDTASKKINKDFLPTIMDSLVYSYLQEQINNEKITSILDKITPLDLKESEKKFFNAASPLVRRLTTLSAIWFFKSKIKDFDYEALLKEKLITACNDLINSSEITDKQKEKINKIKENAELIGQNQKETKDFKQSSDIEKEIITILKEIAQGDKHPENLSQLMDITITLDNTQTKEFADCFETMLRNLCNILAYDRMAKKFSVKKITEIKKSSPLPQLLDFYKKYPTIKEQKEEMAYKEWAKLVSNIPGVLYKKQSPGAKDNNYEIKATFPNLIIIINYLLGLDCFKDAPTEAKQPSNKAAAKIFVAEYLPQFITIFSANENEDSDEEYDDDDKNSEDKNNEIDYYGELKINHTNGFSYSIKISDGHGYMEYIKPKNLKISAIPKLLVEKNPIFWILSTIEQWKENLPPNVFYLFSQPIDKSNFIRELPKKFSYLPYQYMRFIKKLIEKKLTNNDYGKTNTTLKLYSKFIEKKGLDSTLKNKKKLTSDEIIAYANAQLKENGIRIKIEALRLLRLLVKEGQAYQDAIAAARSAIQDKRWPIRTKALEIFKTLVNKEQAYKDAIAAATNASKDKDGKVIKEAIELFKTLVNKEQGYNAAIDAATNASKDENWEVIKEAIELFKTLVNKEQGYDAAINAATIISQDTDPDTDPDVRVEALKVFKVLVNKEQGYDAAIDAAKNAFQDTDPDVKKEALELFKTLVNKEQAYDAAIDAAKNTFQDTDSDVRVEALKVFKVLVNKEKGHNAAINAATITSQDTDPNVKKEALELLLN